MTLATPPFGQIFGVMSGLTLGTLVPNLKSVALIVFELLAFNAEIFRRSHDPGHAPFRKNFSGHVRTASGNIFVKFQVRSFNRF